MGDIHEEVMYSFQELFPACDGKTRADWIEKDGSLIFFSQIGPSLTYKVNLFASSHWCLAGFLLDFQ